MLFTLNSFPPILSSFNAAASLINGLPKFALISGSIRNSLLGLPESLFNSIYQKFLTFFANDSLDSIYDSLAFVFDGREKPTA